MAHTDDTDTAATRLRYLNSYLRQHPVTGPAGHSYISNAPRPTAVHPGLPVNVRVLEHIDRTVAEVVQHTREANPDAGPAPSRTDAVYDWAREQTEHAEETVQQRGEVLEYRHRLEHAVAAGDFDVIRPHRCPDCRTWGLMWDRYTQRIVCTNGECVDGDGLSTTVTFGRLAHEYVTSRRNLRQVSAT